MHQLENWSDMHVSNDHEGRLKDDGQSGTDAHITVRSILLHERPFGQTFRILRDIKYSLNTSLYGSILVSTWL